MTIFTKQISEKNIAAARSVRVWVYYVLKRQKNNMIDVNECQSKAQMRDDIWKEHAIVARSTTINVVNTAT